jgi:hypothetical protein
MFRRIEPRFTRTRSRGSALTTTVGAALGICLLLAPPAFARPVNAQANPPNRFFGTVTINGQDQPEGTVVEAYIGSTLCGSGAVQSRNGSTIYVVDVLGEGQKPNCAKDGDKVTFKVAGLDATETGTYETSAATHLDLTAAGAARSVAQPTVLAPGAGGTPGPPPTFTPYPTSSPLGTSTPPPGVTETPTESPSATPEASATATQSASATRTATPVATSSGVSSSRPASGSPTALRVLIVLAILAIAAGAGVFIYQRRAPR